MALELRRLKTLALGWTVHVPDYFHLNNAKWLSWWWLWRLWWSWERLKKKKTIMIVLVKIKRFMMMKIMIMLVKMKMIMKIIIMLVTMKSFIILWRLRFMIMLIKKIKKSTLTLMITTIIITLRIRYIYCICGLWTALRNMLQGGLR